MEFNYNSVRYFNTRQWTPANSPGRLCGSVRTVSLEKELLGTSALASVSGLPKGLREGEESPFPQKRLILRLQVHRKQLVEGNRASK